MIILGGLLEACACWEATKKHGKLNDKEHLCTLVFKVYRYCPSNVDQKSNYHSLIRLADAVIGTQQASSRAPLPLLKETLKRWSGAYGEPDLLPIL
jgi:hypothetical protein